jgi:hypothetical protein
VPVKSPETRVLGGSRAENRQRQETVEYKPGYTADIQLIRECGTGAC